MIPNGIYAHAFIGPEHHVTMTNAANLHNNLISLLKNKRVRNVFCGQWVLFLRTVFSVFQRVVRKHFIMLTFFNNRNNIGYSSATIILMFFDQVPSRIHRWLTKKCIFYCLVVRCRPVS